MAELTDQIVLSWRPSIRELEGAVRAYRRATRVAWVDWAFGGVMFLFFGAAALTGDYGAIPFAVLGLLFATQLISFAYRWLFSWRNPRTTAEIVTTFTADAVAEQQSGMSSRIEWSAIAAYLRTPAGLMLLMATKGNAPFILVPYRAARDDIEWSRLVGLVQASVRPHPRARGH